MAKILFVALSKEIKAGARYAEDIIRQALSERHDIRFLYPLEAGVMGSIPAPLRLSLLGWLPLFTGRFHDLIFISDNFVYADIVYVQPPAGKDVILTWDEMLFGRGSSSTATILKAQCQQALRDGQLFASSNSACPLLKATF